ncbi:multicopper oxidase domain-containing protein [Cryobacterium sp. GrIS_2_6]|uniref:multicopper oxidase domain-containing protein n=1 Tax=Cryobacterium sp. GrIS_2_6 TaxID=3162785 RepID=UPI002E07C0D6|nr:multicopper oxidase domain-containing protein [Cryobacterium psychrotolerans]MEC5152483.1 nitrite reductase (NO-forming) [Cryobacterium psychrotolerans]
MTRRLWHIITGILVPAWLFLALVVVIVHRFLPVAPWLMVHLLLLGAVSSAVLIWSQHFADTLLRHPAPGGRVSLGWRLAAHTVGAMLVITGMIGGWWPIVLSGGILVGANALAHATILAVQSRGALPSRFAPLVRYYVAAGACLAIGVTLGVLMARMDDSEDSYARLFIGHIGLNLLGWVGLTVIGTVALLWPTILHVRVADGTRAAARWTLPLFLAGLAVLGLGCLLGERLLVGLGVLAYLAGLARVLADILRYGRVAPAVTFAGWSIGSALAWFTLCTAGFGLLVSTASSWTVAADWIEQLILAFLVGFAAQVLLGALTYLLPVVLGGGPRVSKATSRELERGALFRVVVVNGGLVIYLLPVPSLVKVAVSLLVVATLASFLILMIRALKTNRVLRSSTDVVAPVSAPIPGAGPVHPRRTGSVVVAAGALLLAITIGVAMEPASLGVAGGLAITSVPTTGHTTTIDVAMAGMRFSPDSVSVPVGDTLVINLTNADDRVHNLVLDTGVTSGSVSPGTTAVVNAGVVGTAISGWCSIAGHKQLGMVFAIVVTGAAAAGTEQGGMDMSGGTGSGSGARAAPSAADDVDLMKKPAADFVARDARLTPASAETVHTLTLTATNVQTEVSPGVQQTLWTYNGTAPGPTLHGRVGDVFVITFVNGGTIDHSIDFHAGSLAPDRPMRTIMPGESLTYRFTASRSGIWLYHCSTMPMSAHIANGMFGAVIIDPPGLAPVSAEYVLVQSEFYLGAQGAEVDAARVATQQPDLLAFNGYANQYVDRPLIARVGDRVRVWVLDAGPNVGSSFHVVGGQFDSVFKEGDYLLRAGGSTGTGGAQVLDLAAAQGGFVELSFPESGHYSFVSHVMSDAEKGARGIFDVTP